MRRQQVLRHLGEGRQRRAGFAAAVEATARPSIPPEFSPRDYAAYLLSIDAEIEPTVTIAPPEV